MADEASFKNALRRVVKVVKNERHVFRADDPEKKMLTLNPDNTKQSLKYYRQVRSNATHRGKGSPVRDFKIVQLSLIELTEIFSSVLSAAFEEAERQIIISSSNE